VAEDEDDDKLVNEPPEPPDRDRPTEEEAREARRLLEAWLPIAKLSRKQIDELLGARPGFTSKFLRGRARFTQWRLKQYLRILGIPRAKWEEIKAARKVKMPAASTPRLRRRARPRQSREWVELPTAPAPELLDEIRRKAEELVQVVAAIRPPARRKPRRKKKPPPEPPEPPT
jgi:hypothetical protein